MEGSKKPTNMISEREFLKIVIDLNGLLPDKLRETIIHRAHKTYRTTSLPYAKNELEAMVAEGRFLITISKTEICCVEGLGMWSEGGKGSWLVVGVEEEDVINTPFLNTVFGLLPTTDNAFRGLVHSAREGRQRFMISYWPDGEILDSNARGGYLLAGSTKDDTYSSEDN